MRSACGSGSRSPAARTTRSPATSGPGCWSRATPTTPAGPPAGSACTGTSRSRSRAPSSPRRRWPGCTASERRWPRPAVPSTGSATSIVGGDVTTERLLAEAAATPPGADGIVFLPYLAGERSPIWDPTATGVFAGLTLSHGRGHLARAIIEASALAIRHVATPMLAAGVTVTAMRACGGPARSDAWNQVKADVTGFPVLVPGRARDRGPGLGDPRGGGDRREQRRPLGGQRDDPHRPSDRTTPRIRGHL